MDLPLACSMPGLNLYEERSRLGEQQLARWQGLPLCWVDARASAYARGVANEKPVLALLDAGDAEADFDYTLRRVHLDLTAGAMGLFPPGEARSTRWRCHGARRVMIELDPAVCRDLGLDPGEFDPACLREDAEFRDPVLAALLRAMALEVQAGCPRGRIYAETSSMAVMEILQARLGRPRGAARERGRLTRAQLARVDEHIEGNLAGELSVAALAAVVCLSPAHFARLFRQATGSSPHRHVMRLRAQRAGELLQLSRMPLPAVAQACGFAGQSHMNAVVGAALGASPGRIRREALRGSGMGP